SGTGAAAVIE
ncbi:hypothetical protein Tco_0572218, partial [Tanacetum coccineum]